MPRDRRPEYCNLITRDSQGTLWLLSEAQIIATNVNIGETKTSGWDVGVNYALGMNDWGSLSFAFMGTYLDEFVNTPLPGVSSTTARASIGPSNCGTPCRSCARACGRPGRRRGTWTCPSTGASSTAWTSSTRRAMRTSGSGPVFNWSKTLDSQNYLDLAVVYTYAEKYTFTAGVNNFLDEAPPLSGQVGTGFGNGNTFPQVYDALGRYVFFGLSAKF